MKADITDFMHEITARRDTYMQEENKGGARIAQQAITLSEIYSKYDFSLPEFYGHLSAVFKEFARNYETYETEEAEANPAILDIIEQHKSKS